MNRYEKMCGALVLVFAFSVIAIGQVATPALTPTKEQTLQLKVDQQARTIALQAAQIAQNNFLAAQQQYQSANQTLNMDAEKVKADNKWDAATSFDADSLTFTAPAPKPSTVSPSKK